MRNPELPVARGVAVVIHDGRVLLIRRQRAGQVYAVLPGGHVEANEPRAATAVRELAEETTLQAQTARLLWTRDDGGRSASYYLMQDVVGTPNLGGEEAERHTPDNGYELIWAVAIFRRVQPAATRDSSSAQGPDDSARQSISLEATRNRLAA